MNHPLRCLSIFIASAALASAQDAPPAQPALPVTEPVAPSKPVEKPATGESLPLTPGGGKPVPKSEPLVPGGSAALKKNPSDASTYPERYRALLSQAMSSFHSRDFKGALATVDKADAILPATPWSLNIRGAIAIEQRQWDEGIKACVEALRIDPDFFPAKFNLCEIPFYQGKYAESRVLWEKLLALQPKDELLVYRIFLTYLLEGDAVNADTWLKKIPFPSETPSYQYAHAALYFHAEQSARRRNDTAATAKAAEKAEEWIRSAEFIWPEQKRANYVDVLMQLGWVKRDELPTQ